MLGHSGASWDWQVEFCDLEFIRVIGEGTMGKVRRRSGHEVTPRTYFVNGSVLLVFEGH